MNHVSSSPVLVLRHKMSVVPSSLKSPVPLITHAGGTAARDTSCATDVPFISQIRTSPVEASRNRRSDSPVPSKSSFAVRASGASVTVLVAIPRLLEPDPSSSTQVRVRLGFAPELVGLAPDVNVTELRTWL